MDEDRLVPPNSAPPPELAHPISTAEAAQIPAWLKQRALAEVTFAYETIVEMASVPRTGLNRGRPAGAKFQNAQQVIEEYTARADAVAQFAASLKLITPEQLGDAIQQCAARHPGLWLAPDAQDPDGAP
jgi:hypothetical protein